MVVITGWSYGGVYCMYNKSKHFLITLKLPVPTGIPPTMPSPQGSTWGRGITTLVDPTEIPMIPWGKNLVTDPDNTKDEKNLKERVFFRSCVQRNVCQSIECNLGNERVKPYLQYISVQVHRICYSESYSCPMWFHTGCDKNL